MQNLIRESRNPVNGQWGSIARLVATFVRILIFPSKKGHFRDTWPENGLFGAMQKTRVPVFIRVCGRLVVMAEGVGFDEGSAGFKTHNTLIIRVIKQYCQILFHYSRTTRRDTFRDTKPCGFLMPDTSVRLHDPSFSRKQKIE